MSSDPVEMCAKHVQNMLEEGSCIDDLQTNSTGSTRASTPSTSSSPMRPAPSDLSTGPAVHLELV